MVTSQRGIRRYVVDGTVTRLVALTESQKVFLFYPAVPHLALRREIWRTFLTTIKKDRKGTIKNSSLVGFIGHRQMKLVGLITRRSYGSPT